MARWFGRRSHGDGDDLTFEVIWAKVTAAVDDPSEMARWCERALRHRDIDGDPSWRPVITLLYGQALRKSRQGDHRQNLERALTALLEARRLCSRLPGGLPATALHELGLVYAHRLAGDPVRNLEDSIDCHRRALELSTDDEQRAMAAYELGRRYFDRTLGDRAQNIETAIAHFRTAAGGYETAGRLDRWVDATAKLGQSYDRRVRGSRRDNVERALDAFRSVNRALTPQADPAVRAANEHSLGMMYGVRACGDRAENIELALKHLSAALRHLDAKLTPDNWAITHHEIASAYDYRVVGDRRTNLDRALEHLAIALRHCDRRTGPDQWAMVQHSIGLIYQKRAELLGGDATGDRARARQAFEQVLTVRTPQRDPEGNARAREVLAFLDSRQESPGETGAVTRLRAAAEALDRQADPVGWARARVLLEEALAGLPDNHLPERAELLRAALQVHTPQSSPSLCGAIAERLGNALATSGRWDEAADAFRLSFDAAESVYADAVTLLSRREHGKSFDAVPRLAAYCLARAGRLTDAVAVVERGRARVVGDALDRDERRLATLKRDHPQLHKRFRDAATMLRRHQNAQDPDGVNGGRLTEAARRTRAARETLDAVVRRIRRVPGYREFLQPPTFATVAEAVRPDAPIAYLITTDWGSLTLLVSRPRGAASADSAAVRALWAADFTAASLRDLLHRSASPDSVFPLFAGYLRLLYRLVETRFPDGSSAITQGSVWDAPDAVASAGREELSRLDVVGRTLVRPLAAALDDLGVRAVVLIPCGPLGVLPVHTVGYDDSRCLIHDYAVSFAPSARVLRHAQDRAAQDWPTPELLAVANPLPHPYPLWFADRELAAVAAHFPQATRLHGTEATKQRLLDAAATATHVHLACHAEVPDSGSRPSYLELAGGERLELDEIARGRPFPAARMVVLSVCQSALVAPYGAPDEAIGLATAVMLSGTPGVIGALWPINDLSTALLMERFYALHLRGGPDDGDVPMAPAQALARAQRWLAELTNAELRRLLDADSQLDDAARRHEWHTPDLSAARAEDPDARPFADRYYWAPFVYIGQ